MIPKIIHQIWIGKQPPAQIKAWMLTAQRLSGWEYILWNSDTLKQQYGTEFFSTYSNCNYGLQADIYRLRVLKDFGGFYLDCDCEVLKDFSNLARSKFITNISLINNTNICLMADFIGSEKNGRLITMCCDLAPLHVKPLDTQYNVAYITNFSRCVCLNIEHEEYLISPAFYKKYIIHHFEHSFYSK